MNTPTRQITPDARVLIVPVILSRESLSILQRTLDALPGLTRLSQRQRRNAPQALTVVLGLVTELAQSPRRYTGEIMPAHCVELDLALSELAKSASCLKKMVTQTRSAVRAAGFPVCDGRGRAPLGDAWCRAKLVVSQAVWRDLSSLPRWASVQAIDPPDITGVALHRYDVERYAGLNAKASRKRFLAVVDGCRAMFAALDLSGPTDFPTRAYGGYRYSLDESAWSSAFVCSVKDHASQIANRGRPWRAADSGAAARIEDDMFRIASACVLAKSREAQDLHTARDLLDTEVARIVLAFRIARSKQRNPNTHAAAAYQAIATLCLLADCYPDLDATTRDTLRALRRDHAPPLKVNLSVEKQEIVRVLFDSTRVKGLRRLPHDEFRDAWDGDGDRRDVARLGVALAMELGLKYGMWPAMLVRCQVHCMYEPGSHSARLRDRAPVEIAVDHANGTATLHLAASRRSQARQFYIQGPTFVMLRAYLRTGHRTELCVGDRHLLIPGRSGGAASAAALSRRIAALISPCLGMRVTARDLPLIAAVIAMTSPLIGRDEVRLMLGRAFHDHDALFDTIEKWAALADSDRSIAA